MIKSVTFRRAEYDDALFLWALRNSDLHLRVSLSATGFSLESHLVWFQEQLSSTDRVVYVLLIDSVRVGMLRIDLTGSNAEISIGLSDPHTGKGYGRLMMFHLEHLIAPAYRLELLTSKIKLSNNRSINFFENLGFNHVSTQNKEFGIWEKELR